MASSFDNNIRIEEMEPGEQDNTWGDKAKDNDLKLLNAVSGIAAITLISADFTLSVEDGGAGGPSDEASAMVITTGGQLTASVNIIAPKRAKLYIIQNGNTLTAAETVSIKTVDGPALEIPFEQTLLVFCDPDADGGNGEFFTINATVSGIVALATNSLELGGVVAAAYAQLDVKNSWTKPQVAVATQVTFVAGLFTPNADEESTFMIPQSEVTEPLTIGNPTGTPIDGQIMTFQFEQHTSSVQDVTWGTEFKFADDVNIGLTQTEDVVDIFTAMWNENLQLWMMAGITRNLPRTV